MERASQAGPRPRLHPAILALAVMAASLATLSSPRPCFALLGEELPLDHWAYPLVDQLRLRGIDLTRSSTLRPFAAAEIADSLRAIGEPEDTAAAHLVATLHPEFEGERPATGSQGAAAACWLEPVSAEDPGGASRRKVALQGELAAVWGDHVRAHYLAELDTNGEEDLEFDGVTWRGGMTASTQVSELDLHGSGWRVLLGRSTPEWGPSREGLFLSGHHPPLDGIRAILEWRRIRFAWQVAELDEVLVRRSDVAGTYPFASEFPADDTPIPVSRFLSAHRIEWSPTRGLTIGGSEAVIYGGPGRNWEFYYLLPFVPYYSEQWNHDTNDNLMVGLDVEWYPTAGRRLAGELLIDDAQYASGNEPQEVGGMLSWSEVLGRLPGEPSVELEFTRVNSYVYGQARPWNRWMSGRATLGSPLGPDADRWRLTITGIAAPGWILRAEGYWTRKGEMAPDTPRPTEVPFLADFPSGVVERRAGGYLGLEWIAAPFSRANLWIGAEDVRNEDHELDDNATRLVAGAELRLGFRVRKSPLD